MERIRELHPAVYFVGPWSENEAQEVVDAMAETPQGPYSAEAGEPWVAVKEPFETFAVYIANRARWPEVFVAETAGELAVLIRKGWLRGRRPELFHLIYSSQATRLPSDEDLFDLLRQARAKNEMLEITGVLIYREGRFAQLLEGEEALVRDLYATICEDDRHTDLVVHVEEPVGSRLFPNWRMGFERPLHAYDASAGYLELAEIQANAKMRPVVEALETLRRTSNVG